MTTTNASTARNARTLAAFLDAYPDLPEPTHYEVYRHPAVKWLIWDYVPGEQKQLAIDVVRLLPGKATKTVRGVDGWMEYSGEVDGVKWKVVAAREAVCERVVTGTETVTKSVPDPSILVPLVEVTEEVETVEWVCSPLLQEPVA